ncbi:MAG: sigma-70 family RNA polymerase sigma factor [Candidatus Aminicenantes bacterium]|nr:sigma-70 family RNA polymerase sigma factor [Candidatus Aminicenantes bacterium]
MNRVNDFFQREYGKLIRFVRRLIDDTAERDAEDVVMDVMLNIFEAADMSLPIENLSAYIYRSLRNRVVDIFRKRRPPETLYELIDRTGYKDTAREFEKKEMLDKIFEALGTLSEDQRAVLVASDFDGRTIRELSQDWGIPIGTLLARKSRALQKMKRELNGLLTEYQGGDNDS